METLRDAHEALRRAIADVDDLMEERHHLRHELDEKMARMAGLERQLKELCRRSLTKETVNDCIRMVLDYQDLLCNRIAEEAGNIVKHAEDPESPDYSCAVAAHREAREDLRRAEDLENRLRAAVQ